MNNLILLNKEIEVIKSDILFSTEITADNFNDHFITYNSLWTVGDGWMTGINPDESAGMAIFKRDFPGDIMLGFECQTVPPSTHDINFMWNGEWDESLNSCGNAYVGSICGWHSSRAGIEKSPEYKLVATTPNDSFEPGKIYRVQAGSAGGTCFIFIDGKLAIELNDPDPIDNQLFTKIGFTAWSSMIRLRNIVIRQISFKPLSASYEPEF